MTRVFLFHGTGGDGNENWFPFLRDELRARGCEVITPRFPPPEGQDLESWRAAFAEFWPLFDDPSERVVAVAHSIGPAFVLDLLERVEHPLLACFFVAPFHRPLGNAFDQPNASFLREYAWERIMDAADHIRVFASENDPYVPLGHSEEFAELVGASIKVFENAGHFNTAAGFTTFPALLDEIDRII